MQLNIWWKIEYLGVHFGTTMDMAFVRYWKCLCYFRDIWDPGRTDFLGWEEACIKFSLTLIFYDLWVKLLQHYGLFCARMLSQLGAQPTSHAWVGLYIFR